MISAAEWQVMRVVWANPGTTSNRIISALQEGFDWKATTIKTLLGRLRKKKYLEMKKINGRYYYEPLILENEHLQRQLQVILDTMCSTKHGELVTQLLDMGSFSRADLQKLSQQLTQKMAQAPKTLTCYCLSGQCTCHCQDECDLTT